ncbi:MAG: M99 family metallo-carboxypeptidase C-terminal domain-containing protein, partial [Campylobacterota bacterium]
FYQLQAIEAYMNIMGIEYERDFDLNKQSVKNKLQEQGTVTINDTITFDLDELKKVLYYVPLKESGNSVTSDNPLVAVVPHSTPERELFKLNIGHKTISYLYPDHFKMEHGLQKLAITADGRRQEVSVPGSFSFAKDFAVHAPKEYRVNIIGYTNGDENNITVGADQIPDRFSLNKAGTHYRIEFYKEGKFAGMVIAKHEDE